MGWGKAAAAQNQATQQAMFVQAQQAAQAQNALQQGQTQAVGAINRGMEAYLPYQKTGVEATNILASLYGPNGEYTRQPTINQIQMDPSYAFREQQGMKALQQSAAARGGLLSGSTLKGIQNYSQGLASTEYGNAYNRFMADREAVARGLGALAGGGLTAAGGTGTLASNLSGVYTGTAQNKAQNYQNLGRGLGQGYANIGAANASSYMAPTNLLASALGQGAQLAAMYAGGGFGGGSAGMNLASRATGGGGSPFPQGLGGYNAAMGYMRS